MTLSQLWTIKENMYLEMEKEFQERVFQRPEDERRAFIEAVEIIESFYLKSFTQILDNMPDQNAPKSL